MDDFNDVRQAIGALTHAVRAIDGKLDRLVEKVDDMGALAARCVRLDQLADDIDAMVEMVPGAMRDASTQTPLSLMAGPQLAAFADQLDAQLAERRAKRLALLSVESR